MSKKFHEEIFNDVVWTVDAPVDSFDLKPQVVSVETENEGDYEEQEQPASEDEVKAKLEAKLTAPKTITINFPCNAMTFAGTFTGDGWTVKSLLTAINKWYKSELSASEVKDVLAAVKAGKMLDTFSTIRDTLAPNMDEPFEGYPNWDAKKVEAELKELKEETTSDYKKNWLKLFKFAADHKPGELDNDDEDDKYPKLRTFTVRYNWGNKQINRQLDALKLTKPRSNPGDALVYHLASGKSLTSDGDKKQESKPLTCTRGQLFTGALTGFEVVSLEKDVLTLNLLLE